eukprot:jgi/Ulvmu1/9023/UM005_0114.1
MKNDLMLVLIPSRCVHDKSEDLPVPVIPRECNTLSCRMAGVLSYLQLQQAIDLLCTAHMVRLSHGTCARKLEASQRRVPPLTMRLFSRTRQPDAGIACGAADAEPAPDTLLEHLKQLLVPPSTSRPATPWQPCSHFLPAKPPHHSALPTSPKRPPPDVPSHPLTPGAACATPPHRARPSLAISHTIPSMLAIPATPRPTSGHSSTPRDSSPVTVHVTLTAPLPPDSPTAPCSPGATAANDPLTAPPPPAAEVSSSESLSSRLTVEVEQHLSMTRYPWPWGMLSESSSGPVSVRSDAASTTFYDSADTLVCSVRSGGSMHGSGSLSASLLPLSSYESSGSFALHELLSGTVHFSPTMLPKAPLDASARCAGSPCASPEAVLPVCTNAPGGHQACDAESVASFSQAASTARAAAGTPREAPAGSSPASSSVHSSPGCPLSAAVDSPAKGAHTQVTPTPGPKDGSCALSEQSYPFLSKSHSVVEGVDEAESNVDSDDCETTNAAGDVAAEAVPPADTPHAYKLESLHQLEPAMLPRQMLTPPPQQPSARLKLPVGIPPLVFACRVKDPESVRQLLSAGVRVDRRSCARESALLAACRVGFAEGVSELLAAGADVHARDEAGMTSLLLACAGDHAAVVDMLLQARADAQGRRPRDGATAVMVAAHAAADNAVRVLIREGVGVKDCARMGMTSMHFAALGGRARIARRLLLAGAALDPRCASGATPLILAAEAGHARMVAALLRAGVDTGVRDYRGQTAADVALRKGNRRVVQQLWRSGAALDSLPAAWEEGL